MHGHRIDRDEILGFQNKISTNNLRSVYFSKVNSFENCIQEEIANFKFTFGC